jgi:signal transduction histidine kinase
MVERANAELRESHEQSRRDDRLRTIGEVATGIAHEIRHPLASIRGAIEIIESRAQPDSPEVEFSRLAMSEVRRLDRMTWEFLQYARPHNPELRLSSVHDVVTQAVTLLREEAERAGVQLDLETQSMDLQAHIDPLQVEQVLLNVILNAIQATPPGGRIVIREQVVAIDACIDVVDEGPGIPPEHHGRIFNPFFTTRGHGTGLGLAIAHRIVTTHEGRLTIVKTSAAGTHFRILLPMKGPKRAPSLPESTAVPAS